MPSLVLNENQITKFFNKALKSKKSLVLEVGFGMGDNLEYMLSNDKTSLFIGCEPYLTGLANFISKLKKKDYNRVKIYDNDVRLLLSKIPHNSFSKIIILFPDPWPKRRHRKRRLFNIDNIDLFLNVLSKEGEIYFGTDVDNYFQEVRSIFLSKIKNYIIINENNHFTLPDLICKTKYAKKSINKGISPKYLILKKKKIYCKNFL